MNAKTYLNTPVKSCQTCIYCESSESGVFFDHCKRWQLYCSLAVSPHWGRCGNELKEWRPKPPPVPARSLRQWFHDTFLK